MLSRSGRPVHCCLCGARVLPLLIAVALGHQSECTDIVEKTIDLDSSGDATDLLVLDESKNIDIRCFSYNLLDCESQDTDLSASLELLDITNKVFATVPILELTKSSLLSIAIIDNRVESARLSLKLTGMPTSGCETAKVEYLLNIKSGQDEEVGDGSDTGRIVYPLTSVNAQSFYVGSSFATRYSFPADSGRAWLALGKGKSCPTTAQNPGKELMKEGSDNTLTASVVPTSGGLWTMCMRLESSPYARVAEMLVLGGDSLVITKKECSDGSCKVTVYRSVEEEEMVTIRSDSQCSGESDTLGLTPKVVPIGANRVVTFEVESDQGVVCYKRKEEKEFTPSILSSYANPRLLQEVIEGAEEAAAAFRQRGTEHSTSDALAPEVFGGIAAGCVAFVVICIGVAVFLIRRRRRGQGSIKLRELTLT